MSKKKVAAIAAALLTAIVGTLYKCTDESPLFGDPTPAATTDAGAP